MKDYPLDIINAGEETYCLMSLGHHDAKDFAKAISDYIGFGWRMGMPYQAYFVRAPRKGYSSYYYPCDKDHPKAIPATCAEEDYSEEALKFYKETLEIK
jgi:hypothetical protein